MLMTAKFSGVCAHCGGSMLQGSKIDYNRAERRARHPECVTAPDPRHCAPGRYRADQRTTTARTPVEARIFDDAYDEQCRNACGL